ncbi:MAG: hypothetical protein ABGU93_06595 [Acetobacterium sp.]|jgi:hypothetical protein|uniref:hypothetical protein n=1 Tax=Acetobacterium sp. TaxID=1872094 RepID=UPI0032421B78
MKEFKNTRSTVNPEALVVDESSVWVCENIVEIAEDEFQGFEYDLIQYGKDEYIQLIAEKNIQLEAGLTDTQLALVEIYEGMAV